MRIYECPTHDQEFEANRESCEDCKRICLRIEEHKGDRQHTGRYKKPSEVFWPKSKKGGNHGRVIEHLGHTPQKFGTKTQYRNFLKTNKVAEAG